MAVDFKLEQDGIQLTATFSDVVGMDDLEIAHATIKESALQGKCPTKLKRQSTR